MIARFAAFIQHAWNPDTRRFRNFMSYERHWLEESGSEDSHGRTLWALAECARNDIDPSRRRWAAALFKTALPVVEGFSSPRAWAFSLLGLDAYCTLKPGDLFAKGMRKLLADRLMALFLASEREDWLWFEDVLAYDNARISQALIQTGLATHTPAHVEVGLRSLRWLMSLQTTSSGCFRPVGSKSFGRIRHKPEAFDQQPVEACATISACLAAWRADKGTEWLAGATRAFEWFLGENDLQTALIDPDTGSCSDGLHPDRPNENKGAESVLSYLLGLVEIRQFMAVADRQTSGSIMNGIARNLCPNPCGFQSITPGRGLLGNAPRPSTGESVQSIWLLRLMQASEMSIELGAAGTPICRPRMRRLNHSPVNKRTTFGAVFSTRCEPPTIQVSPASGPDGRAGTWLPIHPEPSRRWRRAYFVAHVPFRHHRCGWQRIRRSDRSSRVSSESSKPDVHAPRRRCRSDLRARRRTERAGHLSNYRCSIERHRGRTLR
jgi:hypothetical protein